VCPFSVLFVCLFFCFFLFFVLIGHPKRINYVYSGMTMFADIPLTRQLCNISIRSTRSPWTLSHCTNRCSKHSELVPHCRHELLSILFMWKSLSQSKNTVHHESILHFQHIHLFYISCPCDPVVFIYICMGSNRILFDFFGICEDRNI